MNLDQHTKSAGGFDGVRQWKYQQGMERDTIYIRKANEQTKSDYDLNFHIDLEYRKATLTERFGNYVITFTQPKTAGSWLSQEGHDDHQWQGLPLP